MSRLMGQPTKEQRHAELALHAPQSRPVDASCTGSLMYSQHASERCGAGPRTSLAQPPSHALASITSRTPHVGIWALCSGHVWTGEVWGSSGPPSPVQGRPPGDIASGGLAGVVKSSLLVLSHSRFLTISPTATTVSLNEPLSFP